VAHRTDSLKIGQSPFKKSHRLSFAHRLILKHVNLCTLVDGREQQAFGVPVDLEYKEQFIDHNLKPEQRTSVDVSPMPCQALLARSRIFFQLRTAFDGKAP
jgi:hypothetical protein